VAIVGLGGQCATRYSYRYIMYCLCFVLWVLGAGGGLISSHLISSHHIHAPIIIIYHLHPINKSKIEVLNFEFHPSTHSNGNGFIISYIYGIYKNTYVRMIVTIIRIVDFQFRFCVVSVSFSCFAAGLLGWVV
jgi:hypothetical protein